MNRELLAPAARIVANSLGAMMVTKGWVSASDAEALASNQDVLLILIGSMGLGFQYIGWAMAKLRGWST